MTQEDEYLLLQDLCMRLPYGVKILTYKLDYFHNQPSIETLYEINKDGYISTEESDTLRPIGKPYLFPLSSMTEEQMEELEKLCDMYTPDDDYRHYAYMGIKLLYKHVLDDGYKFNSNFKTDVIDWLNKNHFDYRGLIEKGLAIDANGLNIY